MGMKLQDAIKICCTMPDIQITKKKNEYTYQYIKDTFDSQHYTRLEKILNNELNFVDLKASDVKDAIGTVLLNESYINKVKSMLKIGIPFREALKVKPNDVAKYIQQYIAIENNKRYLNDTSSLNTTGGNTQFVILNYVINNLGFDVNKTNRIKITNDRLSELKALISQQVKTTCSDKKLLNTLKQIFETWNIKNKKNGYFYLVSLKEK